MNEFLTTLRSTHLLLIAVSLALAAFALSPRDAELYHAAQLEAESLTKVDFDRFVAYVMLAQRDIEEEYVAEVRESLTDVTDDLHIVVNDNLDADLFLHAWSPNNGESISRIREFVDDFKFSLLAIKIPHGKYGWETIFGKPAGGKSVPCIISNRPVFEIDRKTIEKCAPLRDGGRLVNIETLEITPAPSDREILSHGAESYKEKVKGEFAQVFSIENNGQVVDFLKTYRSYREVETQPKNFACVFLMDQMDVSKKYVSRQGSGATYESPWQISMKQIKSSPCYDDDVNFLEDSLSKQPNRFRRLFPHLHELWSQVASLSPGQAANQLSVKAMQSRQTLSIGGLSVDERLVSVAGPGAVLSVSAYLLVNLVMLRSARRSTHPSAREPLLYPWFCLHNDRLSRMLTLLTVVVIPIFSTVAILRKADGQWDWSIAFGYTTLCLVVACGSSSLHVLRQIKQLEILDSAVP